MSTQQLHLCFTESLDTKYAVFEIGVKKFGTFRKKKWLFARFFLFCLFKDQWKQQVKTQLYCCVILKLLEIKPK